MHKAGCAFIKKRHTNESVYFFSNSFLHRERLNFHTHTTNDAKNQFVVLLHVQKKHHYFKFPSCCPQLLFSCYLWVCSPFPGIQDWFCGFKGSSDPKTTSKPGGSKDMKVSWERQDIHSWEGDSRHQHLGISVQRQMIIITHWHYSHRAHTQPGSRLTGDDWWQEMKSQDSYKIHLVVKI